MTFRAKASAARIALSFTLVGVAWMARGHNLAEADPSPAEALLPEMIQLLDTPAPNAQTRRIALRVTPKIERNARVEIQAIGAKASSDLSPMRMKAGSASMERVLDFDASSKAPQSVRVGLILEDARGEVSMTVRREYRLSTIPTDATPERAASLVTDSRGLTANTFVPAAPAPVVESR